MLSVNFPSVVQRDLGVARVLEGAVRSWVAERDSRNVGQSSRGCKGVEGIAWGGYRARTTAESIRADCKHAIPRDETTTQDPLNEKKR